MTDMENENTRLKVRVDELTGIIHQSQDVINQFEATKKNNTNSMMEMVCKSLINQ
jgi:hypothetical protein